jgi:hypothetical protein
MEKMAKVKTRKKCICTATETTFESWRITRGLVIYVLLVLISSIVSLHTHGYFITGTFLGIPIIITFIFKLKHSLKCSARRGFLEVFDFLGSPMP